jgi:hypothetical protein
MNFDARVIESPPSVALGGLRFEDTSTGDTRVRDLEVTLEVRSAAPRRLRAVCGASCVYSFHGVPGLRDFENAVREIPGSLSPPGARSFRLRVRDPRERFLPFWFDAQLPCPSDDPFVRVAGESPIPLFSSPGRPVPAARASAHMQLWDAGSKRGANWTLIEFLSFGGTRVVGRGLADRTGAAVAIFPWPEPESPAPAVAGSPPSSSGVPLSDRKWTLELRVFRGPVPMEGAGGREESPDLASVLRQPRAGLWEDEGHTRRVDEIEITYGRQAIVRGST